MPPPCNTGGFENTIKLSQTGDLIANKALRGLFSFPDTVLYVFNKNASKCLKIAFLVTFSSPAPLLCRLLLILTCTRLDYVLRGLAAG
jgi:hypothetical protein